ncbi:MAG TPA: 2-aminoethylphosphonate ABC transporter permease subunit, partial [Devosia sp.]|nr:2-aminoethylphosphonate ABC transporter permease subunit [Devosia sp.]
MTDGSIAAAGSRPQSPALPATFWAIPPLLVVAALFLYPVLLILRQAVTGESGAFSLAQPLAVFRTAAFWSALEHTLEIALASSLGCLVLGLLLALVLSFVAFPGSRIIARLVETFVALPTFLVALAFTFIYGSAGMLNEGLIAVLGLTGPPIDFLYSPFGVILAEVTVYAPFVLRPLLAAFSLIETAQIEVAGSLGARPLQIVREIILPAALPALLAGGSLCLLLTVNEFGVVLFIGAKGVITLPLMVYDKAIQEFDYPTACVVAIVNIALSLGLYSLYRLALAR